MFKYRFLHIWLIGLIFLSSIIQNNQLLAQQVNMSFEHYTSIDGLPNETIHDIYQDSKGFLWFCTDNGLCKFDGYNFTPIQTSKNDINSINFSRPTKIIEDNHKRLWIATNEGLAVYDLITEQFIDIKNNRQEITPSHHIAIIDLLYDKNNNLWIATHNKLFKLSTSELDKIDLKNIKYKSYGKVNADNNTLSTNNIFSLLEDSKGEMWVGTNDGRINCYDPAKDRFTSLEIDIPEFKNSETFYRFYEENADGLWLMTWGKGLVYWNRQSNIFSQYKYIPNQKNTINSNIIRDMFKDKDGKLWIATDGGGINFFDPKTKQFSYCRFNPYKPSGLSGDGVYRIFADKSNTIWIGTYIGGINKYVPYKNKFGSSNNLPLYNTVNYKNISSFIEAQNGDIWVGTDGGGLNILNKKDGTFSYIKNIPGNKNSLSSNHITTLCSDIDGNIWIGTWQGGLNVYNPKTKSFKCFTHDNAASNTIASDNIWSLCSDSRGNIWIGHLLDGMDCYNPKTNTFIHFTPDNNTLDPHKLMNNIIYKLYIDKHQNLWIGNNAGVDKISLNEFYNRKNISNIEFTHIRNNNNAYAANQTICEDNEGNIWIGNERKGISILNNQNQTIKRINTQNGIPSNNIKALIKDFDNNIWISTDKGLAKYDVRTRKISQYSISDGLQSMEFNRNSVLITHDGKLYIGGTNGYNAFYPKDIISEPGDAKVVLTDFRVFNKRIIPNDTLSDHIILKQSISETKEIVLSYQENFISISFASLDFANPEKTQYAYLMKGVDEKWNYTGNKHEAAYTNLSPGTYYFSVKASTDNEHWNTPETTIKITVLPPFWKTTWMYIIYSIIVALIIAGLYTMVVNREKLKNQIYIERIEAQKMQEMNNMKLRIFTNISHEFRTPLTLLTGPLEKLMNDGSESIQTKTYYTLMWRNIDKLKRLINQLLDFRKVEDGFLKLEPTHDDIVEFVKNIYSSFEYMAIQREINYRLVTDEAYLPIDFDPDKMDKIMFNLISNAFKYTPDKGEIIIELKKENNDTINITVSDNGIGIPSESKDKVFTLFYQAENRTSVSNEGTGIGLSLTKELVLLHKGTIAVESELGKGSRFIVSIPQKQENIIIKEPLQQAILTIQPSEIEQNIEANNTIQPEDQTLKSILIVEDNEDVRTFLKFELAPYFSIQEATNGADGLALAMKLVPDLIISDIMMPQMDGKKMCQHLKTNTPTSHIPVILLTARQSEENRIEGYEIGADDYITKPFSPKVLLARINNLLESRQKLRMLFSKENNFDVKKIANNSQDEKFLQDILSIVEKHIANSDFDTDMFANELHLGRSIFFRKIKALTNQTPHDFIMVIRMKKAAEMLLTTNKTISEVAYATGFTEPSNFTRSFKKQYGMSPKSYIESQKQA